MGGRNCGCTTPAKSCNETIHQTVTLSRLARTSAALLQEHQLRCCVFLGGKDMDNMQSRFSTLDIHPKCDFYICISLYHLFTRPSDPSGINLTLDNAKGSEG